MPTDFLVIWLAQPFGLLLIGAAILVPFLFWRLMLGRSYAKVGFKPLAIAYACALAGLVILNFTFAYTEFTTRVAKGLLTEAQRWSLVPGWTIYIVVLYLAFVLPALGLFGVPLAAWLLKSGRLTYGNIAVSAVTFWLLLTVLLWALPTNEWHRTHRLESFVMLLKDFLPGVLFVAVPFLTAIRLTVRSVRHTGS